MTTTIFELRYHTALPDDERYPPPPREIVDRSVSALDERNARSKTLLAHFGFGDLTGALFALLPAVRGLGVAYGLGVWAMSYPGWILATRNIQQAANRAEGASRRRHQ